MKILDFIKRKCTRGFWHTYNFVTFKNKRKQKHGFAQYTIVSACYNVAPYLEDYFTSITTQSLLFNNNIFIVCVDDGSTDETAEIIKAWQKKYPQNITYVHKENGGQASARNLGLQYVKTPYVAFTDPDDFLDKHYFMYIDRFLRKHEGEDICMLCTPLIFYYEDRKIYKNSHPLKHKFTKDHILPVKKITNQIQLSMATAIFNYEYISKSGIVINEKIKPTFEDGNFIGNFLIEYDNSNVAYSKNAKYFYRKRENSTSSLDTSWGKKEKFYDVLLFGYIDLLKTSHEKYQNLPRFLESGEHGFIQHTILYDLTWYVKVLVNNPENISFLNINEKERFFTLMRECFSYIDAKTILDFGLAGAWFYYQVGMLHCFKDMEPDSQIVYVERYDSHRKEVLLHYVTGIEIQEEIYISTQRVIPTHRKISRDDFCGKTFALQHWIWVPLQGASSSVLRVGLDGKLVKLVLKKEQHENGLTLQYIYDAFPQEQKTHNEYTDCWIVMDRNTEADDNGEFFYQHLMTEHPEVNAYFVLEKQSKDWARLEHAGFRLLEYGSKKHEMALRACSKIISSSIDAYVINYFKDNSLNNKHIVFLQHGVIMNNLSRWLNAKPRIDIFVTSTQAEYDSIVSNGSRYKFGTKEVQLTGLPRHDSLWKRSLQQTPKKQILIQPTWRQNLMGKVIGGVSTHRELSPNFMQSDYAQHWQHFLQSDKLACLVKKFAYEVIFLPHPNIQPYLEQFNVPKYIKIPQREGISLQDYFLDAACMITDYSSVAFEMAYLEKPTCYYQFDRDSFFSTGHTLQAGYFDYYEHGFGPVVTDEVALLHALEKVLEHDCRPEGQYLERMQKTFAFKDGKCCERVFEGVQKLC